MLTVTSGPENSQNNWILVDGHLRCSMMLYDTLDLDICSYGVKWELKHNSIIPDNKKLDLLKMLTVVSQSQPF